MINSIHEKKIWDSILAHKGSVIIKAAVIKSSNIPMMFSDLHTGQSGLHIILRESAGITTHCSLLNRKLTNKQKK